MPEDLEGYITVPEAADKIQRSTEQVRRYLREGKLEGRRIGGQWFIRESAVAYLVKGEDAARETKPAKSSDEENPMMSNEKRALFQSIVERKRAIARRWEKSGVEIDAAALVRQLREEAR